MEIAAENLYSNCVSPVMTLKFRLMSPKSNGQLRLSLLYYIPNLTIFHPLVMEIGH